MFIKKLFQNNITLISGERDPLFRVEPIVWPSEASASVGGSLTVGECGRCLFYKILGQKYSNAKSIRLKTICDSGLMYEASYINMLKKTGMYISEQAKIEYVVPETNNNIKVSGKADVIIADEGKIKLVEIKTVMGWKAETIFGHKEKLPLPAAANLMQAMLYKYKSVHGTIEDRTIDEVYLCYINRGDGSSIYFKIDLNANGYPIITAIDESGREFPAVDTELVPSFDDLVLADSSATSEHARLAECRININEVFKKYDDIYTYARSEMLPPKDFTLIYSKEELDKAFKVGKISKIKYNAHNKGKEQCGDMKCLGCFYRTKCMADEGIRLK